MRVADPWNKTPQWRLRGYSVAPNAAIAGFSGKVAYGQANVGVYESHVSSSGSSFVGSVPQGCDSSGNGAGAGIDP